MRGQDDTLEREWEEKNMSLFHYRMEEDKELANQAIDDDLEFIEEQEHGER